LFYFYFYFHLLIFLVFHHDGPFDACNPARNRKGSRRAPMAAFPKDSMNNTIGGAGPVNKNIDLDRFHGHGPDSFQDYSSAMGARDAQPSALQGNIRPSADRESSFVATAKIDLVHGEESMGLGTSTFLEGAPAARNAIQRHEVEEESAGLTRKRSLAQKIRGVSNSRPSRFASGTSPESKWERTTSPEGVQSAGGLPKITEKNPFFQDYDDEYEKKGARIQAQEKLDLGDSSRPSDGLRRTVTESSANDESKSGGFLSRVKSLRGRKDRPERKE
jgi:hypothetical protein